MQKRILVAPLDWGLGHTTRCVPLIRYLQALGHRPVVAGNTSQLSFIKTGFNNIETVHLEGYNITYSKWNQLAQIGLLSQLPYVYRAIKAEQKWLNEQADKLQINGIISDNRYGLYHRHIPSVMLTHQLQVKSGMGQMADRLLQQIHYRFLNRFNKVWVADSARFRNLGGQLSHPPDLPKQTSFIGLLSRFEGQQSQSNGNGLVILLSGPEPQRSVLSAMLWKQAVCYKENIVFIEGSEQAVRPDRVPDHITWYDRVGDAQLTSILQQASLVICRSGYSTLMDLVALDKKAILIPTPGQTEQEYLGRHLHADGVLYSTRQKGFDLAVAVNASQSFPYRQLPLHSQYNTYKSILQEWVEQL